MKLKKYFALTILTLICCSFIHGQTLTIIEQDYNKAVQTAGRENKLILIDFYTSWCTSCKQLDKLIFQNDSVKRELGAHYILLKYNAEKDSIFDLSKKHHVMSYPTALVLDKNGFVIDRKYGFPGNDFESLSHAFFEFVNKGLNLASKNKRLKGYSNSIALHKYPQFYIDYVNRSQLKPDSTAFEKYWQTQTAIFSEEYFSTLIYFADQGIPDHVIENIVKNKQQYETLFGKTDVEVLFYFLSIGKFERAIAAKDQDKFDAAAAFMKAVLGQQYLDRALPNFTKKFLKKR